MSWDVLGVGCATVDDLLYVESYPLPETKTRVTAAERQCGGLCATALVAAARQGARCAYGSALGADERSDFVRTALRVEGIDLTPSVVRDGAAPIHSTIIVGQTEHTRTVLFERPKIVGALLDSPTPAQLADTKVLLVDHYGGEATVRAQELARAAGAAVVADLERDELPAFAQILALTDHRLLSQRFAGRLTGCATPPEAAQALWDDQTAVVVVTCGAAGCWVLAAADATPQHVPAFAVGVVDTTGCGDTFHGVYAAELARGADLRERVVRASAAAALKAGVPGAQRGIPRRDAVDAFLREQWGELA